MCSPNPMSARDIYHDAVKSALTKDNWAIAADPYLIILFLSPRRRTSFL
ncbi:MAG: element excision factor XisH family protein [Microcoleus sp.]